jgi:hypothetical protein
MSLTANSPADEAVFIRVHTKRPKLLNTKRNIPKTSAKR